MNAKKLFAVGLCCVALAPAVAFGAAAGDAGSTGSAASQRPAETSADAKSEAAVAPVASDELLAWAEKADCAVCHSVEGDSLEDKECAASLHGALDLTCVSCHMDDALIDVHEKASATAKVPKKLKKTAVAVEVCASCHDAEGLAEITADSEVLTDDEGTVVNPHDLPDVKDHAQIGCGDCHRLHASKSAASVADALCLSCHHEDVYECGTCHS